MWRRLFTDAVPQWRLVLLVLLPIVLVALLAARWAQRGAVAMMHRFLQDTLAISSPVVRGPLRLIGFAAFLLVLGVLLFPAFEVVELHPRFGLHLHTLSTWTFASGLRVLLVAAFAFAIIRMVAVGVKRFEHDVNFGTGLDALERAKRARTLGTVLSNITTVVVLLIAVLMILHELNVDISPALTGAGIVGVALGFGAQSLVRDIIGGFFLILENQIRVGDSAAINGIGGMVEAINLRTTVLRDEEGTVHVIPNGADQHARQQEHELQLLRGEPAARLRGRHRRGGGAPDGDRRRHAGRGRLPAVHSRPARDDRRRRLRGKRRPPQDADQDRAAEAVVRRTGVPPSRLRGAPGARDPDVVPATHARLADATATAARLTRRRRRVIKVAEV